MLTLRFIEDYKNIEKIIFDNVLQVGQRVILYDGEEPCGIAVYTLSDTINILRVGILSQKRNRRYGDFFTRSIIFKFLPYDLDITIGYYNKYYEKFGFVRSGDSMTAKASEIIFPSTCKGDCK